MKSVLCGTVVIVLGFILGSLAVLAVGCWVIFQVTMPKVATGERFLTPYGAFLLEQIRARVSTYAVLGFEVAAVSIRWLRREITQLSLVAVRAGGRMRLATWHLSAVGTKHLVDVLAAIGWIMVIVGAAATVTCLDVLNWLFHACRRLLRSALHTADQVGVAFAHSAAYQARQVPQRSSALFDRRGRLVALQGTRLQVDLRVPPQQASDVATPKLGIDARAVREREQQPQPALAE